jgi:hypothetical protein
MKNYISPSCHFPFFTRSSLHICPTTKQSRMPNFFTSHVSRSWTIISIPLPVITSTREVITCVVCIQFWWWWHWCLTPILVCSNNTENFMKQAYCNFHTINIFCPILRPVLKYKVYEIHEIKQVQKKLMHIQTNPLWIYTKKLSGVLLIIQYLPNTFEMYFQSTVVMTAKGLLWGRNATFTYIKNCSEIFRKSAVFLFINILHWNWFIWIITLPIYKQNLTKSIESTNLTSEFKTEFYAKNNFQKESF